MLRITQKQMEALDAVAWRNFELEMLAHSKEFSPILCRVIGDERIMLALRQAIARAQKTGFSNRGPIRLYIELMFLCGSDFHTDPTYPGLKEILESKEDQMIRAEKIYEAMVAYNETVAGEGNINVHKALAWLGSIADKPLVVNEKDFEAQMQEELYKAFPQKVDYAGEKGIQTLIQTGKALGIEQQFTSYRGHALLVILMFAFGHGCAKDPLYPWIYRTLHDDRIKGPDARAQRLEKKSLTWLKHVLKRRAQHE